MNAKKKAMMGSRIVSSIGNRMVARDGGVSRAAAGSLALGGLGCTSLLAIATIAAFTLSAAERAFAQVPCPAGLVVVNGTECTVTPGSTITVTPADAEGLTAINPGGKITADSVTLDLNAAAPPARSRCRAARSS